MKYSYLSSVLRPHFFPKATLVSIWCFFTNWAASSFVLPLRSFSCWGATGENISKKGKISYNKCNSCLICLPAEASYELQLNIWNKRFMQNDKWNCFLSYLHWKSFNEAGGTIKKLLTLPLHVLVYK